MLTHIQHADTPNACHTHFGSQIVLKSSIDYITHLQYPIHHRVYRPHPPPGPSRPIPRILQRMDAPMRNGAISFIFPSFESSNLESSIYEQHTLNVTNVPPHQGQCILVGSCHFPICFHVFLHYMAPLNLDPSLAHSLAYHLFFSIRHYQEGQTRRFASPFSTWTHGILPSHGLRHVARKHVLAGGDDSLPLAGHAIGVMGHAACGMQHAAC
jgi:hypothetical protein